MPQNKSAKRKKTLKIPVFGGKGNFKISILLVPAKKMYHTNRVNGDMKIQQLKSLLELIVGIPSDIQRISYLDDAELVDGSDLKGNDIVPGSTLTMRVWDMWDPLVDAVTHNDIMTTFELGVTLSTDFTTPNLEYMTKANRKRCLNKRATVALMIAAHCGHQELCQRLIDAGVELNSTTPNGRSALHIVAAVGYGNIVDMLLANGIDVNLEDHERRTALQVADMFDHKTCGRHLFLFRWQQRAKQVKPQTDIPRKAHQYYDSTHRVGYKGHQLQCYRMQIGPPEKFDSTLMNARPHSPYAKKSFRARMEEERLAAAAESGVTFPPIGRKHDEWLRNKEMCEKRKVDIKKKRRARKLLLEEDNSFELEDLIEDEKLTEIQKAESYDNWLKKQSQQLTFDAKSPGNSPTPSDDAKTKGYLREYLESLLGHKRPGIMSNNWLVLKGLTMLDSVEERPPIIAQS